MQHALIGLQRSKATVGFATVVTVSLLVTAAANLAPTLVSALAVQIRADLGLGETEIGMTVSAFFGVGVATSAVAGRAVERIGPAASLRLAASIGGVVLLGAGGLSGHWLAMLLFVAAAGLGNSLAQPAANLYVARAITRRRQGLALGIQKSGIPAASLLGGLAVPTVALTIGWNWAFMLGGLLAFAVSVAVPTTQHVPTAQHVPPAQSSPTPQFGLATQHGTTPQHVPTMQSGANNTVALSAPLGPDVPPTQSGSTSQRGTKPQGGLTTQHVPTSQSGPTAQSGTTAHNVPVTKRDVTATEAAPGAYQPRPITRPRPDVPVRLLVIVASSTCLAAMGSMALGSFFVLSSVESGIGEGTAGILLMAGSVVGIISRLVMGAGADRFPISPWNMLTAMFAVAGVAFIGFSVGSKAILFTAMPFAFATSFAWPGLFHLAVVRSNPSAPGAATGITMTGSFTGAVCGPLLFGLLVETTTYGWAWGFAAITSATAAAVMAITSRHIN